MRVVWNRPASPLSTKGMTYVGSYFDAMYYRTDDGQHFRQVFALPAYDPECDYQLRLEAIEASELPKELEGQV